MIAEAEDAGLDDPNDDDQDSPKWFQSRYYGRVKEQDKLDDIERAKQTDYLRDEMEKETHISKQTSFSDFYNDKTRP